MARINAPAHPSLWTRLCFLLCRLTYGRVLKPLEIAGHAPRMILPYLMTGGFSHGRTTLPGGIRLLAMQLVGERNGCHWCIDFGRSLAQGAEREKILHVLDYGTYDGFSAGERAALRYADESARTPVEVSDATFAELRRHFDERQIVELTFAIAIESFYNRINASLGVEAQGFCAIAPAAAPAASVAAR